MRLLKKSIVEVFTNPVLLITMVFIDAVFFFMWGFALAPISNSLSAHAVLFAGRKASFGTLAALVLAFFISAFLLYICFHGPAWWLARRIAGKKESLRKYFFAFVKVNLLWFLLIVMIKLSDIFMSLHELATEGALTPNIVTLVLFWLVLLLAFLSYPKPSLKSIFIPLRKSVPLLLFSLVVFELVRLIPVPLYSLSPLFANILGFLLVFPTLVLIRVYAIHVIDAS